MTRINFNVFVDCGCASWQAKTNHATFLNLNAIRTSSGRSRRRHLRGAQVWRRCTDLSAILRSRCFSYGSLGHALLNDIVSGLSAH
jgi:hypothetical protein